MAPPSLRPGACYTGHAPVADSPTNCLRRGRGGRDAQWRCRPSPSGVGTNGKGFRAASVGPSEARPSSFSPGAEPSPAPRYVGQWRGWGRSGGSRGGAGRGRAEPGAGGRAPGSCPPPFLPPIPAPEWGWMPLGPGGQRPLQGAGFPATGDGRHAAIRVCCPVVFHGNSGSLHQV